MSFLFSYFEHLRHFRAAARSIGGQGDIDLDSSGIVLRCGAREVRFVAQFLIRTPDGALTYSMSFDESAVGFIGWLPYFNKRWVEAFDKLAFKRLCEGAGLPMSPWSLDAVDPALGDFVVKSARGSSFGQHVRGPFAAANAEAHELAQGDYAESFVAGQIGKAWYWNDRVVAIGLREPAQAVGDGVSTLAQLVRRARHIADVSAETDFLRFRGLRWSDVPRHGETVTVDFKYGSPYETYTAASTNRFAELADTPLLHQLNAFGPTFWGSVPDAIREGTLYTVDFVFSDSLGIRLLEMNCNPMVPPETYDIIVRAAFAGAVSGMDSVDQIISPRAPRMSSTMPIPLPVPVPVSIPMANAKAMPASAPAPQPPAPRAPQATSRGPTP